MKNLSEIFKSANKEDLVEEMNAVGGYWIKDKDVFAPTEWWNTDEDAWIKKDVYDEFAYVLTEDHVYEIYNALVQTHGTVLQSNKIEHARDLLAAHQLPTEIHADLLTMIKAKDCKDGFNWETAYYYYDEDGKQLRISEDDE